MSGDANTTAGAVSVGAAPTATVGHGEQTHAHPPGSAKPEGGIPTTERPEALVGAAFAGGLAFALILKRLGR